MSLAFPKRAETGLRGGREGVLCDDIRNKIAEQSV